MTKFLATVLLAASTLPIATIATYEAATCLGVGTPNITHTQMARSSNSVTYKIAKRYSNRALPDNARVNSETETLSRAKEINLVSRMMHDFGIARFQAAAAVGWMAFECGNFRALQEKGHTGINSGWGFAQSTGERRTEFMNFAVRNHLDSASDEANYGFLKNELTEKYAFSLKALKRTTDIESASYAWGHYFEGMTVGGPGVPAWGAHLASATALLAALQQDAKRQ